MVAAVIGTRGVVDMRDATVMAEIAEEAAIAAEDMVEVETAVVEAMEIAETVIGVLAAVVERQVVVATAVIGDVENGVMTMRGCQRHYDTRSSWNCLSLSKRILPHILA